MTFSQSEHLLVQFYFLTMGRDKWIVFSVEVGSVNVTRNEKRVIYPLTQYQILFLCTNKMQVPGIP